MVTAIGILIGTIIACLLLPMIYKLSYRTQKIIVYVAAIALIVALLYVALQ